MEGPAASVDIVRDPAGRMRAYYSNTKWLVAFRVLSTDAASGWTPFGEETLLYPDNGTEMAASMAPAAAFVIGAPQTGTTTNETVLPVYEFVLFTPSNHIYLAFSQFGKAVQIADAYQMPFDTVVPQDEQKLILMGLVDSPQPMPAVNVKSRPTPYSSQTLGSITYGTTETSGESHSTNWSWSAGIMSSGKAVNGVGLAWNISFQAGTSGATGGSSATQLGIQLIAQTNLASLTEKDLLAEGALFAAAVVYHRDEYQFYDLSLYGSTYTLATNAPQITAVWIEYTDPVTQAFNAYANTVGNVWSYTRDGWNARMRQLGYPGDNYFEDVIALQDSNGNYVNAVAFPDGPCLNLAWGPTGDIVPTFYAVDNTFTESGWHLNASAYAGISWGLGVELFGLGEKVIGDLLVGGSYSRTTQEKTTDGHKWGITLSYNLQDPPQVMQMYPGEVTQLSWNLWLLKANSQWTQELINYGGLLPDSIDPGSEPWRIVFEVVPETVWFRGDNKNLVYRESNGDVIEARYDPAYLYRYGPPEPTEEGGLWGWTNLTKVATPWKDPAIGCHPPAVGAPCWFAWGLSEPGYRPYTQAVAFRTQAGEIHLLLGSQWPVTSTTSPPPDNTQWQWRNLAQTPGFVHAAGDPVGYHWRDPSGEAIHLFYRGVDGNIHELWAESFDQQQWSNANCTESYQQAQKPASDPCAIARDEDQSEHVFYRANDGKIYGLAYGTQWTLTNLSEVTQDGATPEGKPSAYVWNGSLHVGYRGATGEIHELRFADGRWQQADDLSFNAHATAADQRAAAAPVCGFAWERRDAPQSIHWFYITVDGAVAELYCFDGAANSWGWNNLSEQARGDGNSGQMPAVAEILQANVWYFDPVHGSSMELYLRDKNGSIFELRYMYVAPDSEDGAWSWTELTGSVVDANGNPLPSAAVSGQLTDGRSVVQIGAAAAQ
jgi:hypothetical protein